MTIKTNADELARRYGRRAAALPKSIKERLNEAAKAVNRAAVANLSGPPVVGGYPVPVHNVGTRPSGPGGNLRQNQDFGATSQFAVVFNTAGYAVHIHEGQGSSARHGRRPFLDDAVDEVDPTGMVSEGVVDDLMAVR